MDVVDSVSFLLLLLFLFLFSSSLLRPPSYVLVGHFVVCRCVIVPYTALLVLHIDGSSQPGTTPSAHIYGDGLGGVMEAITRDAILTASTGLRHVAHVADGVARC